MMRGRGRISRYEAWAGLAATCACAACNLSWSAPAADDAGARGDAGTGNMDGSVVDGADADGEADGQDLPGGDANVGPTCEGELVACGDTCTDLSTSVDHCGRCGRRCQSGTCEQGACAPFVVVDQRTSDGGASRSIASFAVAEPLLYFVPSYDSTELERVAVTGGEPALVTYSAPPALTLLTADADGYIYGAHAAEPNYPPKVVSRIRPLVSDQFESIMGATIGTYILQLTTGPTRVAIVSTLSRCYVDSIPKEGATEFTRLASGPSTCEVEIDDTYAYIRDDSSIVRTSVSEAGDATLLLGVAGIAPRNDIALSRDHVVFGSPTVVGIVPKQGGDAVTLAERSGYAVLADDTHVYYLHAIEDQSQCTGGSEVYAVALDGSDQRLLGTELCDGSSNCCISRWAQGDDALYLQTPDGAQIHRLEK